MSLLSNPNCVNFKGFFYLREDNTFRRIACTAGKGPLQLRFTYLAG
jgi:hypothetical protein